MVTKSGKYSESVLTYFIQTVILACRPFKCPFACGSTDRINVLYTGEVKLEGIGLNFPGHLPLSVRLRPRGRRARVRRLRALCFGVHLPLCHWRQAVHRAVGLPSRAFRRGFVTVNDWTGEGVEGS